LIETKEALEINAFVQNQVFNMKIHLLSAFRFFSVFSKKKKHLDFSKQLLADHSPHVFVMCVYDYG